VAVAGDVGEVRSWRTGPWVERRARTSELPLALGGPPPSVLSLNLKPGFSEASRSLCEPTSSSSWTCPAAAVTVQVKSQRATLTDATLSLTHLELVRSATLIIYLKIFSNSLITAKSTYETFLIDIATPS
jgi:hypothetical protein